MGAVWQADDLEFTAQSNDDSVLRALNGSRGAGTRDVSMTR